MLGELLREHRRMWPRDAEGRAFPARRLISWGAHYRGLTSQLIINKFVSHS